MTTETMERAMGVAKGVLANVRAEQLDDPTPCASWKVRDLINHIVGGAHFFAASVEAGQSPEGEPPDLASGDFVASYEEGTKKCVAAFGAPGAQEKMVALPFGTMPGSAFMGIATTDTFTHAWDLAKATGQPTDLDPELAEQLLAGARMFIQDSFRGDEPLPFGPEQQPPEGATAADKLAAFLGRRC
jgi:uncharacterized protein (TIGR03086 family)